jgi:hypothetical protein
VTYKGCFWCTFLLSLPAGRSDSEKGAMNAFNIRNIVQSQQLQLNELWKQRLVEWINQNITKEEEHYMYDVSSKQEAIIAVRVLKENQWEVTDVKIYQCGIESGFSIFFKYPKGENPNAKKTDKTKKPIAEKVKDTDEKTNTKSVPKSRAKKTDAKKKDYSSDSDSDYNSDSYSDNDYYESKSKSNTKSKSKPKPKTKAKTAPKAKTPAKPKVAAKPKAQTNTKKIPKTENKEEIKEKSKAKSDTKSKSKYNSYDSDTESNSSKSSRSSK